MDEQNDAPIRGAEVVFDMEAWSVDEVGDPDGEINPDESVTIRHAGLTVSVPFEEVEGKTNQQILAEVGHQIGIAAGTRPALSRPGAGAVALEAPAEVGTVDAFTDRKSNA